MKPLLDNSGRQKFAITTLIIGAVITLLSGIMSAFSYQFIYSDSYSPDPLGSGLGGYFIILGILGLISTIVGILTIVAFCMWAYRAMDNVHRTGLPNIEHTAGWTVGWFFIPIAFWWKPYQALKEVYQGSLYIAGHAGANWKHSGPTTTVGWWWGFWIGTGIVSYGLTQLNLYFHTSLFTIVSTLMSIAAAFFAIKMIREIGNMQSNPQINPDMAVGGYFPNTNTPQGYRPDGTPIEQNYQQHYPPQQGGQVPPVPQNVDYVPTHPGEPTPSATAPQMQQRSAPQIPPAPVAPQAPPTNQAPPVAPPAEPTNPTLPQPKPPTEPTE